MVDLLVIGPRPKTVRAVPPAVNATGHPSTRLPLASFMPQKTVSSLAHPIVYLVLLAGLPLASGINKAHGRSVAKLNTPVADHLSWLDLCLIRGEWLH